MSARVHAYAHEMQAPAQRWLFFPALVLAFALGKVLEIWHVPWWWDTPAPFGFFGALTWLYNKWGWQKLSWLHGVPNLNGDYDLEIRSSNDDHATTVSGTVHIAQKWHTILVTLKTATSSSWSDGAWLTAGPTQGAALTYSYQNEPRPDAKPDLQLHWGTAKITFAEDGTAEGRYYSDRGRQTFGSLKLVKRPV